MDCLALDQPGGAALLRRTEVDPGCVLSGRANRRRLALGVFTAIQLPKMNRVLLIAVLLRFMDSFHDLTEPSSSPAAAPAIRPPSSRSNWSRSRSGSSTSQGRSAVAGLQSDHPDRVLDLLHRDDQCRRRAPGCEGS